MMTTLFCMIIGYFLGSIPSALLVGRRFRGIDLRQHGSGNLGATNAWRVLGGRLGFLVLGLDILKGMAAVMLLTTLRSGAGEMAQLIVGLCAVLGHMYSPWIDFKGGKGVATALGVFLALAPKAMLCLVSVAVVVIAWTGYVSAGSLTGAVLLPVLLYWNDHGPSVLLVASLVSTMVILKHSGNMDRLFRGTERRVWDGQEGVSPAK